MNNPSKRQYKASPDPKFRGEVPFPNIYKPPIGVLVYLGIKMRQGNNDSKKSRLGRPVRVRGFSMST